MAGYSCDGRREPLSDEDLSWALLFGRVDEPQTGGTADSVVQHGRRYSSSAGHGSASILDFVFSDGYSSDSAVHGSNQSQDHVVDQPQSAKTLQHNMEGLDDPSYWRTNRLTIPATSWSSRNAAAPDTTLRRTWRRLSSSAGSTIFAWRSPDWYFTFYIRRNLAGSFLTYPGLGGPFRSSQEAENAIDCHLQGLWHPTMRKESLDKLSVKDRLIRQSLYWPDGRSKACSKAFVSENTHKGMHHLVQALVDKYNEDHNRSGDRAYELKVVLHYQTICERHIWYYHFNFTAKTKGAGIKDLFFAEVTCMEGHELAVSSFCKIDTNANGRCYGCTNNGGVHMKHPSEAKAYTAGHLDGYLPFGYDGEWDDWDVNVKVEEDRLSKLYEGLDDPDFLKKIFTPPPHATATFIED